MHLSTPIIAAVLASGSPELRRNATGVSFNLVLTVEEGTDCRFSTGNWNEPALASFADRLIDEIGWKIIEHAPGRTVMIRCHAPSGDAAQAICTIERGRGLEPLPVVSGEKV